MIFLDVSELGSVGGPGKTVANETSEIIKVISVLCCGCMTREA